MTDEELAAIRERSSRWQNPMALSEDVLALLAEVDRLRALELAATHAAIDETMAAKYAAWYETSRPIVEAVAAIKEGGDGWRDNRPYDAQVSLLTITQARALLAKEQS